MEKIKVKMKDKKTGYTLKWFGGHGIHIYDGKTEIGFYNTGDFSKESITPEEAKESMKEMIKTGNYEDYM